MIDTAHVSRALVAIVVVGLVAVVLAVSSGSPSHVQAGPKSYLCVDSAYERVLMVEATTPTVCVPFV